MGNSNMELNNLIADHITEVEALRREKETAANELQKLMTVKEDLLCENMKLANEKFEIEQKLGSVSEDQVEKFR